MLCIIVDHQTPLIQSHLSSILDVVYYYSLPTGATGGAVSTGTSATGAGGVPKFPAYRIPEFRWSHLHQQLVSDILFSIEDEIKQWRRFVSS